MSMKFTRYGLLVRKIRIHQGDSVNVASKKIGVPESEIVNIEDRGQAPSIIFDIMFHHAYRQNKGMKKILNRFFVEANQPQILRKCL